MDGTSVWVGGLPDGTDDATFRALFEEHGTIVSSRVFTEKWYGFVNFATPEEAAYVVSLNGAEFAGRVLQIRYAQKAPGEKGTEKGGWNKGDLGAQDALVEWAPVQTAAQNKRFSPYDLGAVGKGAPQVCVHFLQGRCAYGENCRKVHDVSAAPPGPTSNEVCTHFLQGRCAYGDTCYKRHEALDGLMPHVPQEIAPPPHAQKSASVVAPPIRSVAPSVAASVAPATAGSYAPPPDGISGARCASQTEILVGRHAEYLRGESDSSLYVCGLPDRADELYLYKLFAPFGSTLTTFTKPTKFGMIGFVTFATNLDAQAAISILNGQYTQEGTQLQISVQIKKEQKQQKGAW